MNKKNILLFLSILIAKATMGQELKIIESFSKNPIENVEVKCVNSHERILSDENGIVELSKLKKCESLRISNVGFNTIVISLDSLKKIKFVLVIEIKQMKPIVFSSANSRWAGNEATQPYKISKIDKESREIFNPQTAADLLTLSGDVFMQKSQQAGGSPMIRGFATNRLLYSVDGVRMNTAIFRQGNIQNVISLDAFAIDNTEVLFGPGSVMYGSDAIGGVMSFQTLKPKFSKTNKPIVNGNLNFRYSSANDEKTVHIDVNVGFKKLAFLSSFSHNNFGDLRMGKYGKDDYLSTHRVYRNSGKDTAIPNQNQLLQVPSAYKQFNTMQKLAYKFNRLIKIEYAFHYSETSNYGRYDRLIEKQANNLPAFAVWNYGPQKWMMNLLTFDYKVSNFLFDKMSSKFAYQNFEESRIDRRFNNNRLRTQLEKVNALSINFDFIKRINKSDLYYGLEMVQNDVKSSANAINISNQNSINVSSRYPTSKWQSIGLFAQQNILLKKEFYLNYGARLNYFKLNSDFSNNLSFFPFDFTILQLEKKAANGNIGLVHLLKETYKLNLNISNGFRMPNVDDIGKMFDFSAGEVIVPNLKLNPENAINYELSFNKIKGNKLKFDFTVFYTHLKNAIVRKETLVNGKDSILYNGVMSKTYSLQNASIARVYGFSSGVEYLYNENFSLISKFNFQKGEETMSDGSTEPLRHAAPAFGQTTIKYINKKMQILFYSLYQASVSHENLNTEEKNKIFIYAKDQNGKTYSPSWFTLNIKMNYKFNSDFNVGLGIENILDKRYRPYSSGMVAAGRNIVFSANLNFK